MLTEEFKKVIHQSIGGKTPTVPELDILAEDLVAVVDKEMLCFYKRLFKYTNIYKVAKQMEEETNGTGTD